MNEAISARAKSRVYVATCGLKIGTDVGTGCIVDADVVRAKSFLIVCRQPWNIEHLNEMGDIMFAKHVLVLGGDKGTDVQGTCGRMSCNWCRWENLMHRRAHGLHNFRGDLVEVNHGCGAEWRTGYGIGANSAACPDFRVYKNPQRWRGLDNRIL